jgi:hypothetical protein
LMLTGDELLVNMHQTRAAADVPAWSPVDA